MTELIEQIDIGNFKSIKRASLKNCRRINLFIGRPNVGKSNILEALSLFTLPYLNFSKSRKLDNLIRCENATELFYGGQYESLAFVETGIGSATIMWDRVNGLDIKLLNSQEVEMEHCYFDENLNLKKQRRFPKWLPPIKKFSFSSHIEDQHISSNLLIPPYGQNLFEILENYKELSEEIAQLFKEYHLELIFDRASRTLKILKRNQDTVFLVPYHSVADTLQRIIFYKTAIASSQNSVLLFEEPEAHSFPPYITHITQEMIYHKSNQYFIATHSPFILNDLLENAREELSVYMIYYKGHETKIKQLSDKTLHEIYQNGVDVFTNSEIFA